MQSDRRVIIMFIETDSLHHYALTLFHPPTTHSVVTLLV